MRISNFASGLGVALLGVVGAFATAKTYAPNTYFYQTSGPSAQCISTVVQFDCSINGTGCVSPNNHGQLYKTRTSATTCQTTLKRP